MGHLVLYLCECFNAPTAALADAMCTGLQLANFWQDVSRDLDIGRVYLPEEDMRRFGMRTPTCMPAASRPPFAT